MARFVHLQTEVDVTLPQGSGMVEGEQGLIIWDDDDVTLIGVEGEIYSIPMRRFVKLYRPKRGDQDAARIWQRILEHLRANQE